MKTAFYSGHVALLALCACLAAACADTLRADQSPAPAAPAQPATRLVTEADVTALLTTALQRDYVKDHGELELSFRQPWVATNLPDETLTVNILELPTMGVTSSFIVRFQLNTPQGTLGTWQASLQAHVWRNIWVAHSDLDRGTPLNLADIVRERFDVLNIREPLARFSPDDPNYELSEPVASGAPLLARAVKARTIIHRGQVIDAYVRDGALSISTKVEALEDGTVGQVIRARNSTSQSFVSGKVLEDQTILISL